MKIQGTRRTTSSTTKTWWPILAWAVAIWHWRGGYNPSVLGCKSTVPLSPIASLLDNQDATCARHIGQLDLLLTVVPRPNSTLGFSFDCAASENRSSGVGNQVLVISCRTGHLSLKLNRLSSTAGLVTSLRSRGCGEWRHISACISTIKQIYPH